jgi:hypothetical protein
MIIWTAMLFILMSWATVFSQADRCGEPPPVADESLEGAVKGEAQALSRWLGKAELGGQIQTSRKEIFSNYPEAEASRWNAYFQYQVCVLTMQDKSLTTPQKTSELTKIQREFSKPFDSKANRQDLQQKNSVYQQEAQDLYKRANGGAKNSRLMCNQCALTSLQHTSVGPRYHISHGGYT